MRLVQVPAAFGGSVVFRAEDFVRAEDGGDNNPITTLVLRRSDGREQDLPVCMDATEISKAVVRSLNWRPRGWLERWLSLADMTDRFYFARPKSGGRVRTTGPTANGAAAPSTRRRQSTSEEAEA